MAVNRIWKQALCTMFSTKVPKHSLFFMSRLGNHMVMQSQNLCHSSACYNSAKPIQQADRRCTGSPCPARPFRPFHRFSSRRPVPKIVVQSTPELPDTEPDQSASGEAQAVKAEGSSKWLAVGSVGIAVIAFVASRSLLGRPALDELRSTSMSLDSALENGRPTLLEFYADWCEVCKELAPTTLQIEQAYKDNVNFVMLNIENTKWAPEVAEYGVQGVPHFVFLDKSGVAQAAAVGRLPREVLEGDVKALAQEAPLPFRGVKRQTSSLTKSASVEGRQVAPRDHA